MPKRKGPERNANYALIHLSFKIVARLPHVQNKWLHLPVWIELMRMHTPEIELVNSLTNAMLKRAMKRDKVSTSFTDINLNGYYYGRAKLKVKGKSQHVDAILVTEPGTLPQLSSTILWHCQVIIDLLPSWCTRTRAPNLATRSITPPPPLPKRQRRVPNALPKPTESEPSESFILTTPKPTESFEICPAAGNLPEPSESLATMISPSLLDYWSSPEATKFFGYYKTEKQKELSVKQIMKMRIIAFRNAALTTSGWRDLIEDGDIDNKCQAPFIFLIEKKCKFLAKALSILYNDSNKSNTVHMTWSGCCDEAIYQLGEAESCEFVSDDDDDDINEHNDTNHWVTSRTIMQWFRDFRQNNEKFVNVPKNHSLIDRLPPIYSCNPDYKSPHKCHRSVLDTEKQFLDHVVDMMKWDETIAES